MKTMTNKAEFFKVMSFGQFDYDFSLNLSEADAKKYDFDIDQAKSLKDLSPLLKNEDIQFKVQLNSKNKLYKTSESEFLHQDLLQLDFFKKNMTSNEQQFLKF